MTITTTQAIQGLIMTRHDRGKSVAFPQGLPDQLQGSIQAPLPASQPAQ